MEEGLSYDELLVKAKELGFKIFKGAKKHRPSLQDFVEVNPIVQL